jgi:hypothetical protein
MSANLKWRLVGIALIALGAAIAWIFGLGPLREAQAGAARVSYDVKAFVAAPSAIVFGLFLVVGGESVGTMIGGPLAGRFQTASSGQKLMLVAMLAWAGLASFAAWYWFDAELTRLGYLSAG